MLIIILITLFVGCEKDVKNEKLSLKINGKTIAGEYTGKIENDEPIGKGLFEVSSKDGDWSYSGSFKNKKTNGKGEFQNYHSTIDFQGNKIDGIYNGECFNGIINGKGQFTSDNNDVVFKYDGEWKNGQISGNGQLKTNHYTVYFSDLERTGSYDGTVVNGKAHGKGDFTAVNADNNEYTYSGEWKNGLYDGYGKRTFKSKKLGWEIGNYNKGEFRPNIVDFLNSSGSETEMSFETSNKASKFINKHNKLFPSKNKKKVKKFVNGNLNYKKMIKSPSKYGDKLFHSEDYTITQIWENKYWGYTVTEIIAENSDYDNYLYIYYLKSLDVYEGDKISLYALPIDSSSYKNVGGGTTNCYVMLGSYISKR